MYLTSDRFLLPDRSLTLVSPVQRSQTILNTEIGLNIKLLWIDLVLQRRTSEEFCF